MWIIINLLMLFFVRSLLWLRYRVRLEGLDTIARKGRTGILFLPNHPALIDPIIVISQLYGRFKTRALADRHQIDRFIIRRLAKRLGVLPIPDIVQGGSASAREVRKVITQCVQLLRDGQNLVLYPAGRVYRQYLEDIGGNSAVETILRQLPDVRVVLVRTEGLWGSSFSWASGEKPSVSKALLNGAISLLLSGILFCPRRKISIKLIEPDDLPRDAGRNVINSYLEDIYNDNAPGNMYVPYRIWETGGVRQVPEPSRAGLEADPGQISRLTRRIVRQYLEELTGCKDFNDDARLAHDLGMDSLLRADMILWLGSEFGFPQNNIDSLRTVGDVMLTASGEAISSGPQVLKAVPTKWFKRLGSPNRPENLASMTITEAFLTQAGRSPDKIIVADQVSGAKTYRDLVLSIVLLKGQIEKLPGDYIGIMMPASVAANVLYLAVLFAGKTPVMVNWTLGRRNVKHCMDCIGVERILTSRMLLLRIQSQGIDLEDINNRFVPLEKIAGRLTIWSKLGAWLGARISWAQLRNAKVSKTAVVLFTSGSETVPKAVPLTHRNMLTNVSDAYDCFTLENNDSILGLAPPFHSFGLTVSVLLPLSLAIPAVYYPNPTDSGTLGQIIRAYKVTILVGTPTFLRGIVRASSNQQLASLRLVVSGAEKCPPQTYEMLARHCPQTIVLEGYGVTECSPVISVNHQDDPHPGTIGRVMSSLEHVLIDPDTHQPVQIGQKGILLVRGPSVFDGYLNYDGPSPFVRFENKRWYRTGDLVTENSQGILSFSGRLRRFIKLGGEMISLPAIESALEQYYRGDDDDQPTLAVMATADQHRCEIVLFTTKDMDRAETNRKIAAAGLSALHNIRRVIQVDQLPLMGTGKADYRALAEILEKVNH